MRSFFDLSYSWVCCCFAFVLTPISVLNIASELSDVIRHLYSCGSKCSQDASEVHT
jgi:hypothetical protein